MYLLLQYRCVFITAVPSTKLFAWFITLLLQDQVQCLLCVYYCSTYYKAVREGGPVCRGGATILQPWILRLIRNANAFAATRQTLLFRPIECSAFDRSDKAFQFKHALLLSHRLCERRRGRRRGAREGACREGATTLHPWILRCVFITAGPIIKLCAGGGGQ